MSTPGDVDYLLRVEMPDMRTLERFIIERLATIPGVSNSGASFALKQIRYKTASRCPNKDPRWSMRIRLGDES
ncbi:AsnC-like helix-turn-helix protein [Paraburkholderia sp. BL21I4N1]|nr:AsnC-like helix-turn-helix protein [Paraburkholderia sp. BL21I4N1]